MHDDSIDVRKLTPSQANRGLYVDFEGEGRGRDGETPKPTLLGVYCRTGSPSYHCIILEQRLRPLTKGKAGFNGTREIESSLDIVICRLVEQARRENRVILYYSQHEQVMVTQFCSQETATAFEACSGNAKLLIDRWARRTGKSRAERTLDDYCQQINHPPPVAPEPSVAESIRRLRTACRTTNRWSKLTPDKQELARQLLAYNKADCLALRKLTTKAANLLNSRREQ